MLANVSFGFRKRRYSYEILSIGKISNTPFYYRRAYYDNTTRRVNVCVCRYINARVVGILLTPNIIYSTRVYYLSFFFYEFLTKHYTYYVPTT